jgi:hypothetical protein
MFMARLLRQAGRELFRRPEDEIFPDLPSLRAFLAARDRRATEWNCSSRQVEVVASGGGLRIAYAERDRAMNRWSFEQICRLSGAEVAFMNRLAKLAPHLAADALNLTRCGDGMGRQHLRMVGLDRDGPEALLRGITSQSWADVRDSQVAAIVADLAREFVPAGFVAGVDPSHYASQEFAKVPAHSLRGSSGLYAGERDMFLFMADPKRPVEVKRDDRRGGGTEVLHRGFFVWNSEVGGRGLGWSTFLFRAVCANHIVWDAEQVASRHLRHLGIPELLLDQLRWALTHFCALDPTRDVRMVQAAMKAIFAPDLEKARARLRESYDFTKKVAEEAVQRAYIDPGPELALSVWGVVQGLTSLAREIPYALERTQMERRVGRLLREAARDRGVEVALAPAP